MEVDVLKEKAPVAVGSLTTNITAAVIIEESNLNEHKHSSFKIFFNEKKMYIRLCIAFQSFPRIYQVPPRSQQQCQF